MGTYRRSSERLIFLFIAGALVVLATSYAFTKANRRADESAQRALLSEAANLIQEFRAKHGRYPDNLEALALTYPDGGDSSLLKSFTYQRHRNGFHIATTGRATGRVFELSQTSTH